MNHKPHMLWGVPGVGLLIGLCLMAQPQTVKHPLAFEHERDVDTSQWHFVPQWQGSLLVGYEDFESSAPRIFALDRDGKREEILYELPGSPWIYVYSVGAGADGSMVVAGNALSSDSRAANFVTWISPDRKRQVVIRVWPYIAMRATVAADGTIWAVGSLNDEENTRVVAYNVVRRFDLSGKTLSSLAVSARGMDAGADATQASHLVTSRDRVGWFTSGCEYLEFSLDGVLRDRFDGPTGLDWRGLDGVGLSDDNDLVIGRNPGGKFFEVLALDRTARQWAPVSLPEPMTRVWNGLLGFDGKTLVTHYADGRLRRFKPSGAAAANQ